MKTETGQKTGRDSRGTSHQRGSILTSRNRRFIALVLGGKSKAHAYRLAFSKPRLGAQMSAQRAQKICNQPAVAAKLREVTSRSEVKTLLTLNDRLAILARNAQMKSKTASERNAQTRAIDVYSKIAGDGVGENLNVKAEVTGKDGAPIPVAHSGSLTVTDIIGKFRAARQGRNG